MNVTPQLMEEFHFQNGHPHHSSHDHPLGWHDHPRRGDFWVLHSPPFLLGIAGCFFKLTHLVVFKYFGCFLFQSLEVGDKPDVWGQKGHELNHRAHLMFT